MYTESHDIFQKFIDSLKHLNLSQAEIERINENFNEIKRKYIITEKLATVGQLGAGVAHEINNPLGIILMNVQVVWRRLRSGSVDHSEISQCLINLKRVEEAALRCRNIVENLLTFSGTFNLKYSTIGINTLIEEVIEEICQLDSTLCDRGEIQFIKAFDHNIPLFMGDSYKLKQVFLNLVLNAIESIRRITEKRNESWIKITSMFRGGQVKVSISDNGCGIPEENLIRLFDPFFSTKEQGTGLGLAVSYGIIESHDGLIEVDSQDGQGSTFTVILPVKDRMEKDG
ncbi:MAG: sensor histidine kinase [Vulcanimicrobiota bacterium]